MKEFKAEELRWELEERDPKENTNKEDEEVDFDIDFTVKGYFLDIT